MAMTYSGSNGSGTVKAITYTDSSGSYDVKYVVDENNNIEWSKPVSINIDCPFLKMGCYRTAGSKSDPAYASTSTNDTAYWGDIIKFSCDNASGVISTPGHYYEPRYKGVYLRKGTTNVYTVEYNYDRGNWTQMFNQTQPYSQYSLTDLSKDFDNVLCQTYIKEYQPYYNSDIINYGTCVMQVTVYGSTPTTKSDTGMPDGWWISLPDSPAYLMVIIGVDFKSSTYKSAFLQSDALFKLVFNHTEYDTSGYRTHGDDNLTWNMCRWLEQDPDSRSIVLQLNEYRTRNKPYGGSNSDGYYRLYKSGDSSSSGDVRVQCLATVNGTSDHPNMIGLQLKITKLSTYAKTFSGYWLLDPLN